MARQVSDSSHLSRRLHATSSRQLFFGTDRARRASLFLPSFGRDLPLPLAASASGLTSPRHYSNFGAGAPFMHDDREDLGFAGARRRLPEDSGREDPWVSHGGGRGEVRLQRRLSFGARPRPSLVSLPRLNHEHFPVGSALENRADSDQRSRHLRGLTVPYSPPSTSFPHRPSSPFDRRLSVPPPSTVPRNPRSESRHREPPSSSGHSSSSLRSSHRHSSFSTSELLNSLPCTPSTSPQNSPKQTMNLDFEYEPRPRHQPFYDDRHRTHEQSGIKRDETRSSAPRSFSLGELRVLMAAWKNEDYYPSKTTISLIEEQTGLSVTQIRSW